MRTAVADGGERPHSRGCGLAASWAMRSRPIAVIALCTGYLCTACTADAGPAPGSGGPVPASSGPAPGSTSQPAEEAGKPSVLARDLAVPWAWLFLPGGDALVTERDSARLLRVTPHGKVSTVGTVPGVEPYGEGGLLGVAVSASFGRDQLVYLYVSTAADNRIMRFRYSGGGIGPLDAVVTGIPRAGIDNGGRLAFGPDGMLWAATGEHAEPGIAQDRDSLGGKILRMTPDGRPAPGNPFGTLVWTYGHRNVQGMAWDGSGRMYATELGQNRFDEINRIQKGHNYGSAGCRGNRRRPDVHRSRAHLADRGGIAIGSRDSGWQPLGCCASRRAAVADPAGPHGGTGLACGALHR